MITEVNEAKEFLKEKFGDLDSVPPGTYAIPTETSEGPAFMKVIIDKQKYMHDFGVFWDEKFTVGIMEPKPEPEEEPMDLGQKIFELQKYVKHLPECNIMQDWYEADDAMSRIPESMRDDGYYKAQEEIDKKKRTCTCGLEELLK